MNIISIIFHYLLHDLVILRAFAATLSVLIISINVQGVEYHALRKKLKTVKSDNIQCESVKSLLL